MNLTDMRSVVRAKTDAGLADIYSDANIDQIANTVIAELWRVAAWPFAYDETITNTDSNGTAELPATVRRIDTVTQLTASGDRLVPAAPVETGWAGWSRPAPGEPAPVTDLSVSGYTVVGGRLYVQPAGPVALRVRHTSAPPRIPANAPGETELPLPVEFHDAITHGVAVRILNDEADTSGRAETNQKEYQAVVDGCRVVFLQTSRKPFKLGGKARRVAGWGGGR